MGGLVWAIVVVLFVVWLVGLVAHVGGLIHVLLAAAIVIAAVSLLTGRRVAP